MVQVLSKQIKGKFIMDNGMVDISMEKVLNYFQTKHHIRVSTKKENPMVKEYSNGPMVKYIRGIGKRE